jgi:hypothetical protein
MFTLTFVFTTTHGTRYPGGIVNKMVLKTLRGFNEWEWHRSLALSAATPMSKPSEGRWESLPWIKKQVHVTYIERPDSSGRHLSDAGRASLVGLFADYPNVNFRRVRMEEYSMQEQMAIAAQTDVLIGVHGNGLTHMLWMAPKGFVCEIFPRWAMGHFVSKHHPRSDSCKRACVDSPTNLTTTEPDAHVHVHSVPARHYIRIHLRDGIALLTAPFIVCIRTVHTTAQCMYTCVTLCFDCAVTH